MHKILSTSPSFDFSGVAAILEEPTHDWTDVVRDSIIPFAYLTVRPDGSFLS